MILQQQESRQVQSQETATRARELRGEARSAAALLDQLRSQVEAQKYDLDLASQQREQKEKLVEQLRQEEQLKRDQLQDSSGKAALGLTLHELQQRIEQATLKHEQQRFQAQRSLHRLEREEQQQQVKLKKFQERLQATASKHLEARDIGKQLKGMHQRLKQDLDDARAELAEERHLLAAARTDSAAARKSLEVVKKDLHSMRAKRREEERSARALQTRALVLRSEAAAEEDTVERLREDRCEEQKDG